MNDTPTRATGPQSESPDPSTPLLPNGKSIPCTTDGCTSVKFFFGRCNPCQKAWESENLAPLRNPYDGMSWVEECMTKQGSVQ